MPNASIAAHEQCNEHLADPHGQGVLLELRIDFAAREIADMHGLPRLDDLRMNGFLVIAAVGDASATERQTPRYGFRARDRIGMVLLDG